MTLALSCVFILASCDPKKDDEPEAKPSILGTYEMISIEGSVTSGGVTVELEEGLYEYYTIELKEDGKAVVESAAAGSSQSIRQEVTYEYDEKTGALDVISVVDGYTVVEKMTLKDGKITYTTNTTGTNSGITMTINMTIVLEKKAD